MRTPGVHVFLLHVCSASGAYARARKHHVKTNPPHSTSPLASAAGKESARRTRCACATFQGRTTPLAEGGGGEGGGEDDAGEGAEEAELEKEQVEARMEARTRAWLAYRRHSGASRDHKKEEKGGEKMEEVKDEAKKGEAVQLVDSSGSLFSCCP